MEDQRVQQNHLDRIVRAQQAGQAVGIYSVASANWRVIEASLRHARAGDWPLLVESTCNQVNQFGGYTGMRPRAFIARLRRLAARVGFRESRLIAGGDHLGPNPWQAEPTEAAMDKARKLVGDYVRAGYEKIHLDTSMHLGDDDRRVPLDPAVVAARTTELAVVAEEAFDPATGPPPRYVIGTEVPVPGGAHYAEETLTVSDPHNVALTLELHQDAFARAGLGAAWERVIAVVVQPGVEFGDTTLFEYDPDAAAHLAAFIEGYDSLVYEAHSTDYQTAERLKELVRDHFAILKVGPALTFALREAVFALAMIEEELPDRDGLPGSGVREALEEAMVADPRYWQKYYAGDSATLRFKRQFSFSDRCRYYWPAPAVEAALQRLLDNLAGRSLPLSLLSQFTPRQYSRIRRRELENSAHAIIMDHIGAVLADYAYACGYLDSEQRSLRSLTQNPPPDEKRN